MVIVCTYGKFEKERPLFINKVASNYYSHVFMFITVYILIVKKQLSLQLVEQLCSGALPLEIERSLIDAVKSTYLLSTFI